MSADKRVSAIRETECEGRERGVELTFSMPPFTITDSEKEARKEVSRVIPIGVND